MDPELKQELIDLTFSKKQDRENIVACWVFERLVLIDEIIEIKLYVNPFLNEFGNQKHESKRRPFAKILYCYCENEKNRAQLSTTQNDIIVACCFDTLIEAKKVAPKVFTLKTLIYFKDHNGWIIEELKSFIKRELPKNSPAFKATLRQILPF